MYPISTIGSVQICLSKLIRACRNSSLFGCPICNTKPAKINKNDVEDFVINVVIAQFIQVSNLLLHVVYLRYAFKLAK